MNPILPEMESAWPYLLAGDVDRVIALLLYVDHPCRMLRGLAERLKQNHPGHEGDWLRTPNIRLDGRAPIEILRIDDDGSWKDVFRALIGPNQKIRLIGYDRMD